MANDRKPKRNLRLEAKMGDPRKIKTEDFKRSNHEDFATSSELKERSFSGYRMNTITDELEIWVRGILQGRVRAPGGRADEEAVQREFNKIFGVE